MSGVVVPAFVTSYLVLRLLEHSIYILRGHPIHTYEFILIMMISSSETVVEQNTLTSALLLYGGCTLASMKLMKDKTRAKKDCLSKWVFPCPCISFPITLSLVLFIFFYPRFNMTFRYQIFLFSSLSRRPRAGFLVVSFTSSSQLNKVKKHTCADRCCCGCKFWLGKPFVFLKWNSWENSITSMQTKYLIQCCPSAQWLGRLLIQHFTHVLDDNTHEATVVGRESH